MATYFAPYQALEPVLVGLISHAKVSIRVTIYRLSERGIIDALIAAHGRGVDVKITHDYSQSTDPLVAPHIQRLVDAGIDFLLAKSSKGQIIHAKYGVFDSYTVATGSYNWTPTAALEDNDLTVRGGLALSAAYLANWTAIRADAVKYPVPQLTPMVVAAAPLSVAVAPI